MTGRWQDVDEAMVAMAHDDLSAGRDVEPMFAAFAGEQLRFLAFLRPFAKGEYDDPIVELCALAMPLDADRLAVSFSGRVWSFDDPIPPVSAEADLRQRALVCVFVDGARGAPREETVFHPFDAGVDGTVTWHEPERVTGGVGFIPAALVLAVRKRREVPGDDAAICRQALRCVALGHDLHLAPDLHDRLSAAGALR